MRKKTHEYQATKVRPLIQIVARMVKNNPELADDHDRLWANLIHAVPSLGDKAACGSCGRSMKITIYEADLHDALLLLAMARDVRESMQKGIPFTDANKVHLPTLKASHATIKRQTKCDYLGFVKQPDNWRGTGYWLLTGWAWKALRGEPIPAKVKYWEGNLLGRSIETTVLSTMFDKHRRLVELAITKRKIIKVDRRAEFNDYVPSDWVQIAGYQEGALL